MEGDLADISAALRERHGCHTVILYGSRAGGDAGPTSDWDVAGFSNTPSVKRIAGKWRTSYVDAFVYPEDRLDHPDPELLPLRDGRVLFERDGAGQRLLKHLELLHAKGPPALADGEADVRRRWAWKMLERAGAQDVEGNFRRAWLLTALLEDYFALRNAWYLGPKKALVHLHREAPTAHEAFVAALRPAATLADIRTAVIITVGEQPGALGDKLEVLER